MRMIVNTNLGPSNHDVELNQRFMAICNHMSMNIDHVFNVRVIPSKRCNAHFKIFGLLPPNFEICLLYTQGVPIPATLELKISSTYELRICFRNTNGTRPRRNTFWVLTILHLWVLLNLKPQLADIWGVCECRNQLKASEQLEVVVQGLQSVAGVVPTWSTLPRAM
ncbi:hypothetical protein PV05_10072 [Exophiala xenobiotica]|uniref:Uncharacterized protein n=1 Tax=Exophiala xenobiotica TaxID=348802 RepID=A0A0D2EU44_9EURO|nr:uncharacterized protein PV05_10072 [Exophiala xenobiotica]KIW51339.1 hypothetical protein PV05_10072 [Exophiala xenobiotica]